MFQWLRDVVQGTLLPAEHPVVQQRRRICSTCPNRVMLMGENGVVGSNCRKCWCFLNAKTRTPSERCPEGKWPA